MKLKGYYIIACLLASVAMQAQEKTLSLETVQEAALTYSKDIQNGQLRIEQAEASKKAALSNYFPTVEALGVGLYNFNNFIDPIPILLPDGIDKAYLATAVANEVVFAGGKVRNGNKLTNLQVAVNGIRANQSVDSVLLETQQKYWRLVQVQEQQKVVIAAKAYLNALLQQQQDLLKAGLIAKNQLLQVQTGKSKVLLQESKLNNLRKLALLDLALYAGIDFDSTLVASDKIGELAAPELTYSEPDLNLEKNSNYQLLQQSIEASKLQTKMAKSDLYPQVLVGVSATKMGTFHRDLDTDIQPIAFGMVRIPISNWWGESRQRIKETEIEQEIAQNNLEAVSDQLKLGIMQSWYNLQDAYKQMNYAEQNKAFAAENLKVQRDTYNSGLSNLTDVLEAQQTYQEAAVEVVTAATNFKISEMQYLFWTDALPTPELPEE